MVNHFLQQSITINLLGYIGPGAGVAISFSFLTILAVIAGVVLIVLFSPISLGMMLFRRRRQSRYPYRKVVVIGLDGFDPVIIEKLMTEGNAPNFKDLAVRGYFSPLETTTPAISPAAWSSFMTGNDPSYHNIYDFIVRDPRTYKPRLSSSEIVAGERRLRIGKYQIPLAKSYVRSLRKNIPFWKTLGKFGLETTILRVPITYPPEPFNGRLLSGMCVPDLLGGQGSYSYYATRDCRKKQSTGHFSLLTFNQDIAQTHIKGPLHPFRNENEPLMIPLTLRRINSGNSIEISFAKTTLQLEVGQASKWLTLSFRTGLGEVHGLAQFHLISMEPEVQLYMSPIHIHPEKSVMPISHPKLFSDLLSKRIGDYGTLGLMEDTIALNDGVLSKGAFLKQVHKFYKERRAMLFETLDKKIDDVVVCVFDTPDRTEHMFWKDHHGEALSTTTNEKTLYSNVIKRMYAEMDHLIGQVRQKISDDTLLLVVSDHGFTSFKRGVNLNSWLYQNGYLKLLPDADLNQDWLEGVDWSRTLAYAVGLTGIYVNLKGREAKGIVYPGREYDRLLEELKTKLEGLCDETAEGSEQPIRHIYFPSKEFNGPFCHEGPDLIVGYNAGYRCSWEGASGQVTNEVVVDNSYAWSGDHCVDPTLVPGVLFSNYPFQKNNPKIVDIAPTILDLFDIKPQSAMQGRSLFEGSAVGHD